MSLNDLDPEIERQVLRTIVLELVEKKRKENECLKKENDELRKKYDPIIKIIKTGACTGCWERTQGVGTTYHAEYIVYCQNCSEFIFCCRDQRCLDLLMKNSCNMCGEDNSYLSL